MIRFRTLTMRNFLSVGQVTQAIRLDEPGLTLVLGQNMDTEAANSRNGVGKAQPLDAKVLTPSGWQNMGSLTVGDHVVTPDGGTAQIVGVYPQGEKDIWRVTFVDGRSTECCEEHLWRVWTRRSEWGWHTIALKDMRARIGSGKLGDRVYVPLVTPVESEGESLPIEPRTLGILLGDGSLSGGGVGFTSHDDEIVEWIRLCLPPEYTLCEQKGRTYRISLRDRRDPGDYPMNPRQVTHCIGAPLADHGLLGKRAHEKFIPEIYKRASAEQRRELLRGLIDTDGTVTTNGALSFCTTSRQLALDVQELVWSLGGIARITEKRTSYTYRGERKSGRLAFNISIRHPTPHDLVGLERKRARLPRNYQYRDTLRLEIKSVEYVGRKAAQCIAVDHPDHLYITDGYVVTHNTSILQAIHYALFGQPITKIKLDNLSNTENQKNCLVTLDYEINGKRYRIERGRKPNIFRWLVDGKDATEGRDESQGENKHTQVEVERSMGMSPILTKHLILLSTYIDPFLRLKLADQREVIEELLGLTQISERAERLKAQIKSTQESIRICEAENKATTDANQRIEQAINRAISEQTAWKAAREAAINDLAVRIANLPELDEAAANAAFDALDRWVADSHTLRKQAEDRDTEADQIEQQAKRKAQDADRLLRAPDTDARAIIQRIEAEIVAAKARANVVMPPQVARLQSEAVRKRAEAERHRQKAGQKAEEAELLQSELENPDAHYCTTCGQGLAGTDHLDKVMANLTRKLNAVLTEAGNEMDAADAGEAAASAADQEAADVMATAETGRIEDAARVVKLGEELESAKATLADRKAQAEAEAQVLLDEADALMRQVGDARTAAADIRASIKDLGVAPKLLFPTREALAQEMARRVRLEQQLEAEITRSEDDPHAKQIDALRSTLVEIDYSPIVEFNSLLKHQEFLLKLLTSRDSFVRKRLIDRNLMALNKRLNFYLAGLNLPHEVRFMPDLSTEIMLRGKDYDFEQLSRGEQCRVSLATSFAFRDVYEGMHSPCNLLFADEVIDSGMDEAGGEAALDLLRKMALERDRSVFLISHKEGLIGRASRLLMVRKENGYTRLESEGVDIGDLKEAA